jgi:hypothetical protein
MRLIREYSCQLILGTLALEEKRLIAEELTKTYRDISKDQYGPDVSVSNPILDGFFVFGDEPGCSGKVARTVLAEVTPNLVDGREANSMVFLHGDSQVTSQARERLKTRFGLVCEPEPRLSALDAGYLRIYGW